MAIYEGEEIRFHSTPLGKCDDLTRITDILKALHYDTVDVQI
jgi:hypothetical protein